MTASLIYIFDLQGNILDDIEAEVEREYLLNEYGEATWTMSRSDPKCNPRLLRYGNRVLIQSNANDTSGAAVQDWVGVIDPPLAWGDHDVTVTAYSAEYLFTWRRGPGQRELAITGTPGAIFQQIITYANAPEDLFIREGDISLAGGEMERTLELHNMYQAVCGLAKDTGMEWGITPSFDSAGRLVLLANWWDRRGIASNYGLEEGLNIKFTGQPLVEQGAIRNDVLAFSSSMVGWNLARTAQRRDVDSIALYGLREAAVSVSANNGDIPTVKSTADGELKKKSRVSRLFDVVVIGRAAISEMQLGNTYPLRQVTAGFANSTENGASANVRAIGLLWSDAAQEMSVNAEEVIE